MKLSYLVLAASLGSFNVALAQTAPPPQMTPGKTPPSVVPSGTPPVASDPKGAVTPAEVFTKGAPTTRSTSDKRAMRRQKRGTRSKGRRKMDTTM